MDFGISTSCLYPQNTESALETLGKLGVKTCEIFLNSISETTPQFAKTVNRIKEHYGMNIVSVHPFSSFSETYMLFSEYKRRFYDVFDFYKRCFEFTNLIEADITIIHGSLLPAKISRTEYFERFAKLVQGGREFGVRVCQENVFNHLSESPDFLKEMKTFLGKDFKMVFDIKQAVKSGFSPLCFANEFKDSIVHVHASDHCGNEHCLPPSKGDFDFKKLFEILKSANYDGSYIIELYRSNFGDPQELCDALEYLANLQ